ncbi:hypothetical protein [Actinoplanes teichomyceticus]|uniref:Uncharacterized protein n=1 Tax=Actinoplanes teichomyceticus TaxID=1867 RepID=A0A561WAS4_ACTTI|nr:hypothetical protein [Actinoplanes teichomyceticus]TWG20964.1 hypothetical protein FHX34_103493 [Actinoplanes teichomyceticus]GIF14783.1 hypothetical protein Ate01nite_48150 [Actinoplanes teichomyceticus]
MPDIIGDGKEAWWWVLSITNPAAPTKSEIDAGIRISQWMTKDGATGFAPETADAPTSSIESTFDTNVNGRRTFSGPRIRLKKQSGVDTAYNAMTPDATGYLVRRKSLAATTATATGQAVQVFPAMCAETAVLDVEDNMPERYDIPIKITAEPKLRATIA